MEEAAKSATISPRVTHHGFQQNDKCAYSSGWSTINRTELAGVGEKGDGCVQALGCLVASHCTQRLFQAMMVLLA